MSPHFSVLWSVRLSMLCYAASLLLLILKNPSAARPFYSAGCVFMLLHIPLALHYAYHWNHDAMVDQTAKQTLQTTGVPFKGGPYINYAFALVWLADTLYWHAAGHPRYQARPKFIAISLHAFLIFIAFNATVVFAAGPTRYAALIIILALFTAFVATRQRRPNPWIPPQSS